MAAMCAGVVPQQPPMIFTPSIPISDAIRRTLPMHWIATGFSGFPLNPPAGTGIVLQQWNHRSPLDAACRNIAS